MIHHTWVRPYFLRRFFPDNPKLPSTESRSFSERTEKIEGQEATLGLKKQTHKQKGLLSRM